MDDFLRGTERRLLGGEDLQSALALIRHKQRSGQEYIINFQTLGDTPIRCSGRRAGDDDPCAFSAGHDDVNHPVSIFKHVFPSLGHPEEFVRNINDTQFIEAEFIDSDFDTNTYDVGASLDQQLRDWIAQFNTPDILFLEISQLSAEDEESYREYVDSPREELRPVDVVDDQGDLERTLMMREAFVVDLPTHQLITRVFRNVVDHYLAPNYLHDVARRQGSRRRLQGLRSLRMVLNGALLSRLSMYREMSILKVTTEGTTLL